jgi:hypothetical protein
MMAAMMIARKLLLVFLALCLLGAQAHSAFMAFSFPPAGETTARSADCPAHAPRGAEEENSAATAEVVYSCCLSLIAPPAASSLPVSAQTGGLLAFVPPFALPSRPEGIYRPPRTNA